MREKLKESRKTAGLTALKLGQLTGISEQKVYALERGRNRSSAQEALRLAAVLGVPPIELFPDMPEFRFLQEGKFNDEK